MKLSYRFACVHTAALLILPPIGIISLQAGEVKAKEKAPPLWTLATNADAAAQLQEAADSISQRDWKKAIRRVQQLLDSKRGALVRLTGRDSLTERYVSVHAEAERLLATLPEAGRRLYQARYGPLAAARLEEEGDNHDSTLLVQIVDRYLYTEAGLAALGELARWHFSEGRRLPAVLAYARLLEHVGPARWTNDDLYQAAVAFHQRGRSAQLALLLKELRGRAAREDKVQLSKRWITLKELREEFERAPTLSPLLEWPMYRGDASRSNRGIGGPPVLEALWRQPLIIGKERSLDSLFNLGDLAKRSAGKRLLKAAELLQKQKEPIIPAVSPIAVAVQRRGEKETLLIYRNYFGIVAVDPRDGSLAWTSTSAWSLQRLLDQDYSKRHWLEQLLEVYERHYPQMVFANSARGAFSTDGEYVYIVDDLEVPPPPIPPTQGFMVPSPQAPRRIDFRHVQVRGEKSPHDPWPPVQNDLMTPILDKDTADAIQHNRLFALSLARNGALTWAWGEDQKDPLGDCYFLGPPLPLDGLLYLLIQRKQQVSLVCIDPHLGKERFAQPKVVFIKPLVEVRTSLLDDPVRRIQAAHLAYGEGILVCPTNAGVVLGIDLLLNRLAWAYPYRQKDEKAKDPPAPALPKHWKTIAPLVAEGKVVFTPPDDLSLYCLNLKDGSPLWSHIKSDDDVYLAGVYRGKVLIVGTKSVQALSLSKGELLWKHETGLPSGQGIASGGAYYLPLERGSESTQPEILVLDLDKGQVIAHHKMPKRKAKQDAFELPGNLTFVGGKLISLTPWEIVAYPLRGGK